MTIRGTKYSMTDPEADAAIELHPATEYGVRMQVEVWELSEDEKASGRVVRLMHFDEDDLKALAAVVRGRWLQTRQAVRDAKEDGE